MHALPWPMTTESPFVPTTAATSRARSKSADVREFDLQKIGRLLLEHRQRVLRRAHAFLCRDRDADGAA